MRQPTPLAVQLAWHEHAINGSGKIEAKAMEPHVGFYKRKLVSGGPWVPARIWTEQECDEAGELVDDEYLRCEVNGREVDVLDAWPRLWNNCITEAEFKYMEATRKWATAHAPSDPASNPYTRINPLTSPVRF